MSFRPILDSQIETMSPHRDVLLRLFETHLLNALVEGHSATRLIESVRAEYIAELQSQGLVPTDEWGSVLEMLNDDLCILLRESIIQHSLSTFGDFVASVGEIAPVKRAPFRRRRPS